MSTNVEGADVPRTGHRNAAGTYIGRRVPTTDAASVLILRDGGAGLEVLLVERHVEADFSGGALVFPGGKVVQQDRELDPDLWTGVDPSSWRTRLGAEDDATALGLLVAAVRETFEETGILLATRDDRAVRPESVGSASFTDIRARLCDRSHDFDWRPWLREQELVLDLGALALFAWWVTPEGQHRRFDTRFLVAALPVGQRALPDEVETTALRWATPETTLAAQARGDAKVVFPTRRILRSLGRHDSVRGTWEAAHEGEVDQRRTQPTLLRDGDDVLVRHPFDGVTEPL